MSFLSKIFSGKPASDKQVLPPAGYAERYADYVRSRHPSYEVRVQHGDTAAMTSVHWKDEQGGSANQFIGNCYSRYLLDPDSLDALFEEQRMQAETTLASFDQPGPVLDMIMPVLKPVGWYQVAVNQLKQGDISTAESRFVVEPFVDELVLTYVEDRPDQMSYLSPKQVGDLGLDQASLFDVARSNLRKLLPQLVIKGGGGRFAARLDRNYDASMILLFDEWRDRVAVEGDPVIALPARDEVLICGSADTDTISGLRQMAAEIVAGSPYSLSARLFVWREDRLQVLAA
ncbi:hypothetical protein [Paraburkholderia sp.]|uniref:hypothetical protein n=1 Tax=Paraburkholderia sp. TaxID=1926495 RepID=UPI003D6F31B9